MWGAARVTDLVPAGAHHLHLLLLLLLLLLLVQLLLAVVLLLPLLLRRHVARCGELRLRLLVLHALML